MLYIFLNTQRDFKKEEILTEFTCAFTDYHLGERVFTGHGMPPTQSEPADRRCFALRSSWCTPLKRNVYGSACGICRCSHWGVYMCLSCHIGPCPVWKCRATWTTWNYGQTVEEGISVCWADAGACLFKMTGLSSESNKHRSHWNLFRHYRVRARVLV